MAYWLTQLTPEVAEAHDRRVYNAEDPAITLGWKPYTYRATRNAVAQWACIEEWDLERRLRAKRLKIAGWSEWRDGVRTTRLIAA